MAEQVSGVAAYLKVNTGTAGTPIYTLVSYQRNATLTRELDTIETTAKSSSGNKEFITGFRSWSMEFDGMAEEANAGFVQMKAYWSTSLKLQVQLLLADGVTTQTGYAILTSLSVEEPMDGVSAFSASFQGSGALTQA